MEKQLIKEFDFIYSEYKVRWEKFYDANPSDISKKNNMSFFVNANKEYRKEIMMKSIEFSNIHKNIRESYEFKYFIMFNELHPEVNQKTIF